MRRAVLTRLGYSVGDICQSVEESSQKELILSPAETLKEAGFGQHHLALPETTAYQLAYRAVDQIRASGASLSDVDAIFYATCIPHNANVGEEKKFQSTRDVKYLMDFAGSHLQTDFGMEKAIVFGLSQQACTGLLGSIRLAQMLIQTDPNVKKAICLTSDRFPQGATYEQAYNLISDGAAAALVESDVPGFEVRACHQLTNGAMAQASDDETVGHFFNYTSRLVKECLQKAELQPSDINWVVPQNTNAKAWQILSRLLGISFEKIALETLSTVGHMISGDNIVNLQALDSKGLIQTGDHLLLLMAGYGLNWQAVILKKTA